MRTAKITRTTAETQITIDLNLDGTGTYDNQTGVGFFDHMLDQLARHAMFDLTVRAKGDHHIDDHHTVEDTGIALGQALVQAVGDKKGIQRYGEQSSAIRYVPCAACHFWCVAARADGPGGATPRLRARCCSNRVCFSCSECNSTEDFLIVSLGQCITDLC